MNDKKVKKKKQSKLGNPAFYKGMKSANPNGRPIDRDFKALKDLREMSKAFFETKIAMALQRSIPDLQGVAASETEMAIDVCLSRILLRACIEGDHRALDFLFDRIIGKVMHKEDVKLPVPFVVESLDGKTVTLGMEMKEDQT